jgi:hypothetical protein
MMANKFICLCDFVGSNGLEIYVSLDSIITLSCRQHGDGFQFSVRHMLGDRMVLKTVNSRDVEEDSTDAMNRLIQYKGDCCALLNIDGLMFVEP